MVSWKLFENFNFEKSEKWYLQNPQTVTENVNQILIWDMNIQCDNVIVERKPDFFIANKMENSNNHGCCNNFGQENIDQKMED